MLVLTPVPCRILHSPASQAPIETISKLSCDKGLGEKERPDKPGGSVFFTIQNSSWWIFSPPHPDRIIAVMEFKYDFLHMKQTSMSWEEKTAERQKQ